MLFNPAVLEIFYFKHNADALRLLIMILIDNSEVGNIGDAILVLS